MKNINSPLKGVNKIPNYIFIFFFSILGITYFSFAITSTGYDDEFWTIGIIENIDWKNILSYFQTNDIHPPLSYIFNKIFYHYLQNWNYVRAFLSIFLITSTINLTFYIKKNNNDIQGLTFALIFLCNPAVLMWGTSIRWYTYFLIIFNWLLVVPKQNTKWFDIKLILALLLLSFTGYIAFIFIIPIFLYYYSNHNISWNKKFILILKNFLIYSLIFSYQIYFFIKYHASSESPFDANLFFPIKNVIVGFYSSFLSNQGIMPFSLLGLLSGISTTFLLFLCFYNLVKSKSISNIFVPLLLSLVSLITSGAAGYLRIFISLTPLQSKWISNLDLSKKKYFIPILIILISQIFGMQNVISHSGTTKQYFNIPVGEVIQEIDKFANECGSKPIVFHHIKALSFHLNRKNIISMSHIENDPYIGRRTIGKNYDKAESLKKMNELRNLHLRYLGIDSPYKNNNDLNKILNSDNNKCVIVVDSFRGFNNFPYLTKIKMLDAINKIQYSSKKVKNIGFSKDFFISKKIAKDYPKYSVTIHKFVDTKNLNDMKIWLNLQSN